MEQIRWRQIRWRHIKGMYWIPLYWILYRLLFNVKFFRWWMRKHETIDTKKFALLIVTLWIKLWETELCLWRSLFALVPGFHWPVFSRIRTESTIVSLYGRIRVGENLYFRRFYAVNVLKILLTGGKNGDTKYVANFQIENTTPGKEKILTSHATFL